MNLYPRFKVIVGHIFIELIITIVKEMQASRKDRQAAIKVYGKLDIIVALKLSKTHVEAAKNLYKSQIEAAKHLHEFQVTQVCTSTKKAMDTLIDYYIGEGELLMKRLEFIRNKYNVFIFILLSKIPNIQKQWLITECNKKIDIYLLS